MLLRNYDNDIFQNVLELCDAENDNCQKRIEISIAGVYPNWGHRFTEISKLS